MTIAPRPAGTMTRSASRAHRNVAFAFTEKTWSQASSEVVRAGCPSDMPAAVTIASTRP